MDNQWTTIEDIQLSDRKPSKIAEPLGPMMILLSQVAPGVTPNNETNHIRPYHRSIHYEVTIGLGPTHVHFLQAKPTPEPI